MKTYTGEEVATLLRLYIKQNSFIQEPEAANYGINDSYEALEVEDLDKWITKQFAP